MPRTRRHQHIQMKRSAGAIKAYVASVIIVLIVIVLVLALRVAQDVWPAWLIEHRTQIIGILLLGLLATLCLSPIIVEFSSHPRHLSGPGHDPRHG